MQIFHHYSSLELDESTVVGIGNFDGLHKGHLALINQVLEQARSRNLKSAVLTFSPHPMRFFKGAQGPQSIYSTQDRLSLLEALQIDVTLLQEFNRDFAQLSPQSFVNEVLIKALKAKIIVVGYDFAFGHKRSGRVHDLNTLAQQSGAKVDIIDAQNWETQSLQNTAFSTLETDLSYPSNLKQHLSNSPVFSSTWIRTLLKEGQVELAEMALGRPYHIRGQVCHGHKRGRAIGFPTANLAVSSEICPQPGVYAGWLDWGSSPHKAIISIGTNPTFQTQHRLHHHQPWSIEAHVLGEFDPPLDLYNKTCCLWFNRLLRQPVRFDDLNSLTQQIKEDCLHAHTVLNEIPSPIWPS